MLVLVQLAGGNDGFNTIIPFADDRYYELRPNLAVARTAILQLNCQVGLHPACRALHGLFQTGQLAIIQGVGHTNPSFCHFHSASIWATADPNVRHRSDGWIARWLDQTSRPAPAAVYFGRDTPAVFHGKNAPVTRGASCLTFPQTLGRIAGSIATGRPTRVYHVTLAGFDTHRNQAHQHHRLLHTLSEGLVRFQRDLQSSGDADRVLTMTYSEFGRSAAENQFGGTDHGTLAPMLLVGTRVKGGLHGAAPSLDCADNSSPPPSTDFRSVYATVLEDWLQCTPESVLAQPMPRLPLLS